MPGIKELKTRIRSIGGMRKVTRAMQMVSAAKMRKAQQAALNSRSYSDLAWELISNLSLVAKTDQVPALLKIFPGAKKTVIIFISTNKGLVGSFNANLVNKLRQVQKEHEASRIELVVMGRKAKEFAVRSSQNLAADFQKSDNWISIENIYPLARMISGLYQSGQYKQVLIVYNRFVSTLIQNATIKQLLPFENSNGLNHFPQKGRELQQPPSSVKIGKREVATDYLFEPSPELVLNNLLPRIIESQIYQAVLESDASEHSARMVMMKNATEAAGDLIADYTLTYNQLRQNKITTELAEITAGRIALE